MDTKNNSPLHRVPNPVLKVDAGTAEESFDGLTSDQLMGISLAQPDADSAGKVRAFSALHDEPPAISSPDQPTVETTSPTAGREPASANATPEETTAWSEPGPSAETFETPSTTKFSDAPAESVAGLTPEGTPEVSSDPSASAASETYGRQPHATGREMVPTSTHEVPGPSPAFGGHRAAIAPASYSPMDGKTLRDPPKLIRVAACDQCFGHSPDEFWKQVERDLIEIQTDWNSDDFRLSVAESLRTSLSQILTDYGQRGAATKFIQKSAWANSDVWIIGDLHGDALSLMVLLRYAQNIEFAENPSGDRDFRFVFLGDFVDDGALDTALLTGVLEEVADDPGRNFYLQGNHDIGISFDEATGKFRSSVSPSDFCDRLNAMPANCAMHELARAAIAFFQQAPAALLLPDGLLIAHGGVPHTDLQQRINSVEDLNDPEMVTDFVWTRLHESARRKVPNRTTRGCSLGFEDFDAFCDKVEPLLGQQITGMVRGHDHVPERFLVHERYRRRPVVTINAMCRRQRGDVFGPYARKPVIARWRCGLPLEIHQIEIPEDLITRIYPPPDTPAEENSSAGESAAS